MEVYRRSSWLMLLLGVSLLATTLQGVQGEAELEGPSESECRPFIEKALKELETGEGGDARSPETGNDSKEDVPTIEITTDDSGHQDGDGDDETHDDGSESAENSDKSDQEDTQEEASVEEEIGKSEDIPAEAAVKEDDTNEDNDDNDSKESDGSQEREGSQETGEQHSGEDDNQGTDEDDSKENATDNKEETAETDEKQDEDKDDSKADDSDDNKDSVEEKGENEESAETNADTNESADSNEGNEGSAEDNTNEDTKEDSKESGETVGNAAAAESAEEADTKEDSKEDDTKEDSKEDDTKENDTKEDDSKENDTNEDDTKDDTKEDDTKEDDSKEGDTKEDDDSKEGDTKEDDSKENDTKEDDTAEDTNESKSGEQQDDDKSDEKKDTTESQESSEQKSDEDNREGDGASDEEADSNESSVPEEELSLDIEIPSELRERDHVEHLLKIDAEASETEEVINRVAEITLRELKKLYENAIKPLEVVYKYRDLSNRHFGDAEIFSKPLILFMGPWSGGKSSIINYLLDNEYNETSLRTGAEPSPAYFNILMYGDEPEIVDGTQLAADFTFSGLQKFGQGLEERLRGVKLPSKLLDKVNIVEIPGILEVRKQVSRVFPFNDACQWFIDRADIIFLVYDPSKLDVGPETEAILDQLKGREAQTRIVLNKADQVKPEELMRVQGALIWNISPLMSSAQPPVMYTTSLWSRPYESWAPVRLLQAQERAFLRDLRSAIDKRIENKIASARRFAVRVRNHAKMVDCYLTTYYNHKSVFGNRKLVSEQIIEHPQDYHIYEGLSTLTNISRYDLPDPDVYKDFFKLNPLYDFQQLSATCTYFRGCPINRLDIAIAYDLPELVGKHKRLVESALAEAAQASISGS